MITVKELIDILSQFNPEEKIYINFGGWKATISYTYEDKIDNETCFIIRCDVKL